MDQEASTQVTTEVTQPVAAEQPQSLLNGGAEAGQSETVQADDKPAEAEAAEEGKGSEKAEDEKEPAGAPEAYEDFTVPEGLEIDQVAMDSFKDIAKNSNLDQETAQKFVDLYNEQIQKMNQTHIETVGQWAKDSENDKEFGGRHFQENLATANKGLKNFFGDGFIQLLTQTGLGNHPEAIRGFHKIGLQLKDGSVVKGAAPKTDPLAAMYPTMFKQD